MSLTAALLGVSSFGAELQQLSGATLARDKDFDGDSFAVAVGDKALHVRLYFVDCPETSVSFESGVQRVEEQARYFGLPDVERTLHFGQLAKDFSRRRLARPFTVHTAFADAPGGPGSERRYAFITTSEGEDLARLLVENGLARIHGVGRDSPNGIARDQFVQILRDAEAGAMLKRVGIWKESDPDQIATLRAAERREEAAEKELFKRLRQRPIAPVPIDLNRASKKELQSISGIGPVLAERIIAGRPYGAVDELLKVKGIGPKTLANVRSFVTVVPQSSKDDR